MSIPLVDLSIQHREIEAELREGFDALMQSGAYILGPQVSEFEAAYAAYSEVAAPDTKGISPTSPDPPISSARMSAAALAPAMLSVATKDTVRSDLTPESMVTTGMPRSMAV